MTNVQVEMGEGVKKQQLKMAGFEQTQVTIISK